MGSLVWVLNLWAMRIAAGAVVLSTMSATVALYQLADRSQAQLIETVEKQSDDAEIFETVLNS